MTPFSSTSIFSAAGHLGKPRHDSPRGKPRGGPSIYLKSSEMNSADFKVFAARKRLYAALAAGMTMPGSEEAGDHAILVHVDLLRRRDLGQSRHDSPQGRPCGDPSIYLKSPEMNSGDFKGTSE